MGRAAFAPPGDGARRGAPGQASYDRRPRGGGPGRAARGRRRRRAARRPAEAQPRRVRPGNGDQHRPAAGGGDRARDAPARRRVGDGRARGPVIGATPQYVVTRVRAARRARGRRGAVRRPEHRARSSRVPLRLAVTPTSASCGCPTSGRRSRRRRLDAEDEDPPLGGRRRSRSRTASAACPGVSTAGRRTSCTGRGSSRAIVDVAAAVRPDLAIVDGIVGMEGNGPISGDAHARGRAGVRRRPGGDGRDRGAGDGPRPERIGYLREAGRFLGQVDLEEVIQAGEDLDRTRVPFRLVPQFAHLRAGSTGRGTARRQGRARARPA